MFYLKGRTLIQRHHTSSEMKCCLISVTPLLRLSSSVERERLYATLTIQASSLLRSQFALVSTAETFKVPLGQKWGEQRCLNNQKKKKKWWAASLYGDGRKHSTFLFLDQTAEAEAWMRRRRGEETRTDIILRTVSLPTLIPPDWQIGTMAALARMPSHTFPPRNLSVSTV